MRRLNSNANLSARSELLSKFHNTIYVDLIVYRLVKAKECKTRKALMGQMAHFEVFVNTFSKEVDEPYEF